MPKQKVSETKSTLVGKKRKASEMTVAKSDKTEPSTETKSQKKNSSVKTRKLSDFFAKKTSN